jgi:hypothetical protein
VRVAEIIRKLLEIDRCAGCAEPFCFNCLVKIQGVNYCGQCKVMALQGSDGWDAAMVPCKEADEALKYAIAAVFTSLFCIGVVFGRSQSPRGPRRSR